MDFFESLFDFNGDGKVDWLDTADELAIMEIIEEDIEKPEHSSSTMA